MPPKQKKSIKMAVAVAEPAAVAAADKAPKAKKAADKVRIIRHNISFSQLIQTYFF